MKSKIKPFLDSLTPELEIIPQQVYKYYEFDNKTDFRKDGALKVFNRPWIAPENYAFLLFPSISIELINKYEKKESLRIPDLYKDILMSMNGCFIHNFALFGIPLSISKKNLLDRSDVYQLDLSTANNFWLYNYNIASDLFHFGSQGYNQDENTGYFIDKKEKIYSILPSGQAIRSWTSFKKFMTDEILEAEKMMRQDLPKSYEGNN